MRRRVFLSSVIVLVTLTTVVAIAAVPTRLTVQGKLTDPAGTPQTGTYTFTFRIFDASAGGTEVWTGGAGEAQAITTDVDGIWTAQLGASTALTDAVFSGTERWLEINVDDGVNPAETLSRVKLNTNPFSYRISTIDGSAGGTVSGDLTVTGNVGVGTSSPGAKLDVLNGNLRASSQVMSAGLEFYPATGGVPTNAGSIVGVGGSTNMAILPVGNLGIGTASPSDRLDVAGGNVNLENSTSTAGNILKSGARFIHNFGNENTFVGVGAGNLTMSGTGRNTASGALAFQSNTTGRDNTAIGRNAMFSNTTGGFNSAIGSSALSSNTTGADNTAAGAFALQLNTSGRENTAGGKSALQNNTLGDFNTANGSDALLANTTGDDNTAVGASALGSNSTGLQNTACGGGALFNNSTGRWNTAIGMTALWSNIAGDYNTATGRDALRNSTGAENTANGVFALFSNSTGGGNTACGNNALYGNTTGGSNTAIGYDADVSAGNLSNATAIGANATVDASNKIRLGSAAVTVLECQVALTVISDSSQKENVRAVDGDAVLRKLRDLNVSSWNYKGHDPEQFRHYGPMAQEFFAAFGHDGVGTSGTPTTINSGDMAGILMIAVQALEKRTAENEELKARVEALEKLVLAR